MEYRVWIKNYDELKYDYNYFKKQCKSKKKDSYECQKKEYFKSNLERAKYRKPKEPEAIKIISLDQLIKNEQRICHNSCSCTKRYDRCFSNCGGKIIFQKFCVQNCD